MERMWVPRETGAGVLSYVCMSSTSLLAALFHSRDSRTDSSCNINHLNGNSPPTAELRVG